MKPVETENTTLLFVLEEGDSSNNLPAYSSVDDRNNVVVCTVWELSDEERKQIVNGNNVRVVIWGSRVPPMLLDVTDEKVGPPAQVKLENACARGKCDNYVACATQGHCSYHHEKEG